MLNGFPDNFRMGDEDVLNEFRQKQANFDLEEKRNEINNSRSLFIGALAGLAMAAVVGWVVLAPQYQSDETEDIPLIRRPQEEVKIPPVEPGSVDISNQEKTVYDIIERKSESPEEANVLPPSEQPNADALEALVEEVSARKAVAADLVKAESLASSGKPAAPDTEAPQATADEQTPAANKVQTPAAPEPQIKQAKQSAPKVKETLPTAAKKQAIAKGAWQIQLISSPNKTAVEKSWNTMVKKHKILAGLPHEVSSVDLGAKGTYYRLKVGNFATKDEAVALCGKLKAAGGSCFPARK